MRGVIPRVLTFLALIVTGYLMLCVLVFFAQDSMLFYPTRNDPALAREWQPHRVTIPSGAHTLEGWWAENASAAHNVVALYFGGNAEDVLSSAAGANVYNVRHMLFVNYRGYGGSAGKPSQQALYADALAIYDYAIRSPQGRDQRIVVIGRSLGSAAAALLAAERRVDAVVLITPFESVRAVAESHYPFLPVRWLLQHPFPSHEYARRTQAPVLILAAERDRIIPPRHARALYEVWNGPKQIAILPEVGHNDIDFHPDFHPSIHSFLDATVQQARATTQPH